VRILLISLYFPPDLSSTGMLMEQLAHELVLLGHDVTVVSARPHHTAEPVRPGRRSWLPSWEQREKIRILWLPVPTFGARESTLSRLSMYAVFNVFSLLGAFWAGRHDIVFTPSPPLTNGLVSSLVGRLWGIPSVYIVHDLVPEAYVQFGVVKNPLLIRFLEGIEATVYRWNTRVSVLSASFRDHLAQKHVPIGKIDIVPNFADLREIDSLPRANALSTRLGLDGKFVVMHAGTIAYRHGVEVLIDAARLLVDLQDVVVLIVGDGAKQPEVEAYMKASSLPNVRMMPFLPREDLAALRACADVQTIVLRRGMTSHSVPCKVYEIMASERPFVAAVDEGSTIWQLAHDTGCGVAVTPESASEIATAVRRLYTDRTLAAAMAGRGRAEAQRAYSSEAVGARYDQIFRELAGRGGR
jgi:colanic acid biosynthesis glycosyl transferase WcaI